MKNDIKQRKMINEDIINNDDESNSHRPNSRFGSCQGGVKV